MKINSLKQQLKDAKDELSRQKDRGTADRQDESLQATLGKLLTTERQNEELKLMYQQMKDSLQKDFYIMDKKYKKA